MGKAIRNDAGVILLSNSILSDERRRGTAVSGQRLTGLDVKAGIVGEFVGRLSRTLSMNSEFRSCVGNSRVDKPFRIHNK